MLGNLLVGSLIFVGTFLVLLSSIALIRGVVAEGGSIGIGELKFNLSGTFAALVLGVLCLAGAAYLLDSSGAFDAKNTPPLPGAELPSTDTQRSGFAITTPTENEKISGSKGVLFEGTAPPMGSDTLRIMTIASSSQDKLVFYMSSGAISPDGGRWSYQVSQIGAGITDIGSRFTFVVVEASESCSQELDAAKPDTAGDTYLTALPHGCRELGRRTLTKTSA